MLFCKFWNTVISKTTIESKSATKPFVNVTRPSKAKNKIIPIIESDSNINLKIADNKQAVTGVHSSEPKTKVDEWVPFQSHSQMDSEMPQGIIGFQNNSIFCCITIFRCLDSLKKNPVFVGNTLKWFCFLILIRYLLHDSKRKMRELKTYGKA